MIGLGLAMVPLIGLMVEPVAGVGGFGLVTCGAVHFGFSRWAKSNPEVRDVRAPQLTRRARALLERLVKHSIGVDRFGQKYYMKFVRQSAPKVGKSVEAELNPEAFVAFERLATSYNRAYAAAVESPEIGDLETRAMQEAMAAGLDSVAALQEFPERTAAPNSQIDAVIAHLDELHEALSSQLAAQPSELRERIAAWKEALGHDEQLDQVQT